ncbi:hypothetical protein STIUS_v1c01970 [Spiroplasma sp. TIUS-1]|uniref:HNH endonuclease n=1 Tax=Spiroplasma sp. TIUS-1 TaxID=216963 RepID=UPI0013992247|nr:HNH endonuclease [Spiroplasma sp. TIUS-1]QHX35752.1 hypothetical protein STIUS_v1c01970 [Spiroplasma sp. TIUS-1]
MNQKNKYLNFNNGAQILMTDENFQRHQRMLKNSFKNLYLGFSKEFKLTGVESFISLDSEYNFEKTDYIEFKNGDINHRVYLREIKNSGQKDVHKKRIHIEPKMYCENKIVSVIGLLSLGNETLYCVTDYLNEYIESKFIKTDNSLKNNSSLWINQEDMMLVIQNKEVDFFINSHGSLMTKSINIAIESFNKNKEMIAPKRVSADQINTIKDKTDKKLKSKNDNNVEKGFGIDDLFDFIIDGSSIVPDFDWEKSVDIENNNKLIRNKNIIQELISLNNECFNCKTKTTFDRRNGNGMQYFEFHHFIPYNYRVQKKFKKTLDSKLNIIALCVSCHKGLHLSSREIQEKMIMNIYKNKVNDEFIKYYPNIKTDELLNIYWELFNQEEK